MDEHETLLGSKVDILPPKERVNEVIDVPNHEHQSIPLVRGALYMLGPRRSTLESSCA